MTPGKHRGVPRGFDRPAYYTGISMILTSTVVAALITLVTARP